MIQSVLCIYCTCTCIGSYCNLLTGQCFTERYKHDEPAYVETVKVLGHEHGNRIMNKISITFRVPVSLSLLSVRALNLSSCSYNSSSTTI